MDPHNRGYEPGLDIALDGINTLFYSFYATMRLKITAEYLHCLGFMGFSGASNAWDAIMGYRSE